MTQSNKCDTCGKIASDDHYSCIHNFIGFGFLKKGTYDNLEKKQRNFSYIPGKLFCDNCRESTGHHIKEGHTNGKTFCNRCGNMTEYTERFLESEN